MRRLTVKLFGDSIIGRVIQDPSTGRYRRMDPLEDFQDQDLQLSFVNCGKFGSTICKGRKLIERQLEGDPDCQVILAGFGGNDCNFNWPEIGQNPSLAHEPSTPLDVFYQNFLQVIKRIKEAGIKLILANLPPIDAEKFFDTWIAPDRAKDRILGWLGDKQAIYRWHEMYSMKVEVLARETDTPLLDIRSPFLGNLAFQSLIGPDGMHPTEKGHGLILEAARDFIRLEAARSLASGLVI